MGRLVLCRLCGELEWCWPLRVFVPFVLFHGGDSLSALRLECVFVVAISFNDDVPCDLLGVQEGWSCDLLGVQEG
jgi:hypothetical protein